MRITDGHECSELTGLLVKIETKKVAAARADAIKASVSAGRTANKI